jgi:hypothetical protein
MVFMYCCPYLFLFRISGVEVVKTVPEHDIRGGIWLIGLLCERAFRSRLTLREEGQVASLESPNGLGAIRRVKNGEKRQAQNVSNRSAVDDAVDLVAPMAQP